MLSVISSSSAASVMPRAPALSAATAPSTVASSVGRVKVRVSVPAGLLVQAFEKVTPPMLFVLPPPAATTVSITSPGVVISAAGAVPSMRRPGKAPPLPSSRSRAVGKAPSSPASPMSHAIIGRLGCVTSIAAGAPISIWSLSAALLSECAAMVTSIS